MNRSLHFSKHLHMSTTPIPGLTIWELPVFGDERGWFKENWQRERMTGLGLPDFGPSQNNVSFNKKAGTTRGIHAEPWDKFVSVAAGAVHGAWVDLRRGPNFGVTFETRIDPTRAIFVPRGVGNAFQTLEPNTVYTYLVNDHYSPDTKYVSVNLADDKLGLKWPIRLDQAIISEKDLLNPRLGEVESVSPRKILVLGKTGQLGRALRREFGEADIEYCGRDEFDLSRRELRYARRWRDYDTIVNAGAYTSVDSAESADGRAAAWRVNVSGVSQLAQIAAANQITLVHLSSDYVFAGEKSSPYSEADTTAPLSVYGQTKAAGDHVVSTVPQHYIVRTSWVIGDGRNFVRTMLDLAKRRVRPMVVNDQRGRLSFASELAQAIRHLLDNRPEYGIYNMTGAGAVLGWDEVARLVFEFAGYDPGSVQSVSSTEYYSMVAGPVAPRPRSSALDLQKITATGFMPADAVQSLRRYIEAASPPPRSRA